MRKCVSLVYALVIVAARHWHNESRTLLVRCDSYARVSAHLCARSARVWPAAHVLEHPHTNSLALARTTLVACNHYHHHHHARQTEP